MRSLLTPRWIAAHLVVLAVVIGCVTLGLWQLDRLEDRRLENLVGESRFEVDPVDFELVATDPSAGTDPAALEFLRVRARGRFQSEHEVLIRSQVHRGTAGFHVLTPLLVRDGLAVLVNRGWVPLGFDQAPLERVPPPSGEVTVEGWLQPSQERRGLGPADPAQGRLTTLNRVDLDRVQEQVPFRLTPVYLVALGEDQGGLPVPVPPPDFDDEGPHLAYAVQWFGFALVGAVGYVFLIRRSLTQSGGREDRQIVDDLEPVVPDEL